MNKCILCSTETIRPKFCSTKCIKRDWVLRHNPKIKSLSNDNPDFWKTETGIGLTWELYGSKLLNAEHLRFSGSNADLNWNGLLVDVKACNEWRRKKKRGKEITNKSIKGVWVFNRNKIKPIDFFLCFCLKENKIIKVLLIPEKNFGKKGITVGITSDYDKFSIKWK